MCLSFLRNTLLGIYFGKLKKVLHRNFVNILSTSKTSSTLLSMGENCSKIEALKFPITRF